MNTATQLGTEKQLRDMYMYADRFRGPEAYVLAYDHAYMVGQAIAENGNDLYLRAKAAGLTGAKIILKGYESKELGLTNKQLDTLQDIIKKLEALPDDTDKFYDYCVKEFKDTVRSPVQPQVLRPLRLYSLQTRAGVISRPGNPFQFSVSGSVTFIASQASPYPL